MYVCVKCVFTHISEYLSLRRNDGSWNVDLIFAYIIRKNIYMYNVYGQFPKMLCLILRKKQNNE